MQALTRRRAISRLGLLAGGAAAAPVLAGGLRAGAPGGGSPALSTHFDVVVQAMRPVGAAHAGQRVLAGAVTSLDGAAAGWFHIVETTVGAGGRFADPTAPRHLEQHTVQLPAGTIIGQGSTRSDGSGHFAVVGGTGAYHGATGSYRGTRTSGAFGGDRATYSLSLIIPEDADHGR